MTAQPDTKLPFTVLEVRVPKSTETSPEAMAACLQSLPKIHNSFWKLHFGHPECISLEIVVWHQRIYFLATVPTKFHTYFTSQLSAQYPQASISEVGDYIPFFFPKDSTSAEKLSNCSFGRMKLERRFYFPLKTYQDFSDVDPLSTVLGNLAKTSPEDKIIVQYLVTAPPKNWQKIGTRIANTVIPTSDPEKSMPHPQKALIEAKVAQNGFSVTLNLVAISQDTFRSDAILANLASSFANLSHGEGNSLIFSSPKFWQKKRLLKSITERTPQPGHQKQILTQHELATLFHLPNQKLIDIRNIAWGGTLKGEPPENLPVALGLTDEEKREINFFAQTEFKSQKATFGIKTIDRRKHIYIIGKTGVGKSTLIANMAISDMRNNKGIAIIDPHGDLCDTILDYIPSHRLNDVVYLNPKDTQHPFRINPLEVSNKEQADLVASGILAIFQKLFAHSWGPRLEYILRNTLLTLCYLNDTTLLDVTKVLTNTGYRKRIIEKTQDQALLNFWNDEFNKMDDRQRNEAISPILNKVGQFITSPRIRTILERPHSSVNLEEIMNSGKILLLNLSQGLIGEDNAALLGAMFITKIQQAAMNRVSIPEPERKDFYLYVDEFQNFATSSFVKILSEARKYRLNLTVANQYTAQVSEEIQKAIFGNVGTLISFLVGSADASLINKEFGNTYDESDLVGLDNFEVITKLSIDNRTGAPFPARTLPLPQAKNSNRETAIQLSTERYGKPNKNPQNPHGHLTNPSQSFQSTNPERKQQAEDAIKKLTKNHNYKINNKEKTKQLHPKSSNNDHKNHPKSPGNDHNRPKMVVETQ